MTRGDELGRQKIPNCPADRRLDAAHLPLSPFDRLDRCLDRTTFTGQQEGVPAQGEGITRITGVVGQSRLLRLAYPAGVPTPNFASAEAAALSSYSPAAEAHVIGFEVLDSHHVDVIIDFVPSHLMRCHCELTSDGWVDGGDIVE